MNKSNKLSVSIVIPNYNGSNLLKKHLPRVIETSEGAEIIVADDASTDDSIEYLNKQFPKIKIVKHSKNNRYAAACNSGVELATGNIIVLLNNDVSPHRGYLKPMLRHFNDEKIFAVGCKEIDTKDGIPIESGRGLGSYKRGFLTHWRAKDQNKRSTLWTTGGSMAVKRDLWEKLGGMDTIFAPAYEEDRDLSYRALKRGYKVIFEPKSVVDHHHETTNVKELGRLLMKVSSYKNQLLFVWKNITETKLIISHLLWLPYHLVFTSIRSRSLFLIGFLWAVTQMPLALKKRSIETREQVLKDSDILRGMSQESS